MLRNFSKLLAKTVHTIQNVYPRTCAKKNELILNESQTFLKKCSNNFIRISNAPKEVSKRDFPSHFFNLGLSGSKDFAELCSKRKDKKKET